MKHLPLLLVLILPLLALPALAQDDPGTETGTETARPDDAEALRQKALESLMGQPDETPETTRPVRPAQPRPRPEATAPTVTPTPRPVQPVERDDREESRGERTRRDDRGGYSDSGSPPGGSVPEVSVPEPDDEDTYDSQSYDTPSAPLSDYRSRDDDTLDEQPTPVAGAEGLAGQADAQAPPRTPSPASAVIIGLIILALLLVILAAVVGVMAAQRQRPLAGSAIGPSAGWAYLSAPGAPDISLEKVPFLIGSSQACSLRLADPKASPQHARIDRTVDGYVLTDLGSVNGTFLNGERIGSPVSLRPGDEVQMGDITVTFEVYE